MSEFELDLVNFVKAINQVKKQRLTPHSFKKGDIIQVGKSKTTGVIIRTTEEDIIFRTFDKGGWSEAVTSPEHVTKIDVPKKTKENVDFEKFLKKYNKKVFVLNQDFITYMFEKRVTILKGDIMIIDEQQNFLEQLSQPCKEGYSPTQICVSYIEGEDVFTVVRCFRLLTNEFLFVPLSFLTPFDWDGSIYDKLVLPEKDRILNFVKTDGKPEQYGVKFHKGNGKSLLFYGAIGAGKSMTAEALSHKLQKPLIRVDIEDKNPAVAIQSAFIVANRYDGIVFIDEAEMLLANRNMPYGDILSIRTLLKYMEEFPGIIIFCTNYVNDIDPALNNRIDLKQEYVVTNDLREKLWKLILPKKINGKFDFKKYSEKNLNGRDIQKIVLHACRRASQCNYKKIPISLLEEEIEFRIQEKKNLSYLTDDNTNVPNYFG